jgi:hypothetical protein
LFNWRKSKSVIHKGKTTNYAPENNVYVYFRYNEAESVMIVINNSNEKEKEGNPMFTEEKETKKVGVVGKILGKVKAILKKIPFLGKLIK